uniref:Uncharacterized protein n=1 Tax=Anguilla anguilla TaxID=7936 RepID=A0A0E9RS31_ANGAN
MRANHFYYHHYSAVFSFLDRQQIF